MISDALIEAKIRRTSALLVRKNVVGVAVGYKVSNGKTTDTPAIVALVERKISSESISKQDMVPQMIDGYHTDVIEIGRLKALGYTSKMRPAQPGISIGHYDITAGTFGSVVYNSLEEALILSNNHVLAATNSGIPGDPIYQPGPIDGGRAEDTIASLERFVEIKFGEEAPPPEEPCKVAETYSRFGNAAAALLGRQTRVKPYQPRFISEGAAVNYVDCAIARPTDPNLINPSIVDIGTVTETADAAIGMKVQKTGRTTQHTTGTITLMHASVFVGYGQAEPAYFEDQIITGNMSMGGDSGSLLVTNEASPKAVGLLFAGSSSATIFNPINMVMEALAIHL